MSIVPLYRDPITGHWNLFYRGGGELGLLKTHSPEKCSGEECDIHNRPEEMSRYSLQWRMDRSLLEQVCDHGVGHPSPGEVSHSIRAGRRPGHLVHGCCSEQCCKEWNERK